MVRVQPGELRKPCLRRAFLLQREGVAGRYRAGEQELQGAPMISLLLALVTVGMIWQMGVFGGGSSSATSPQAIQRDESQAGAVTAQSNLEAIRAGGAGLLRRARHVRGTPLTLVRRQREEHRRRERRRNVVLHPDGGRHAGLQPAWTGRQRRPGRLLSALFVQMGVGRACAVGRIRAWAGCGSPCWGWRLGSS